MLPRLLAFFALASLAWGQDLEQAKRAFDKGDFGEAARLFERAQQQSPGCDVLFYLGLARYRQKQPDAAIIAFQSAVECDPKLVQAQLALGEAYAERGNDNEAVASFLRVLSLDAQNVSALHDAAAIYLKRQANEKAVPLLEALVRLNPKDLDSRVDLAAVYTATGNRDAAESQFQDVLRLQPNHAAALLGLGSLCVKKGDDQRAIGLLQKAARAAPKSFEPHYLLGSAYNRLGRYQQAADELETAVRLGGNESEVYYHLARAYGGLGRPDDRSRALARFTELSKKAKSDAEQQRRGLQLIDEARPLLRAGDLPAAIQRLEEARGLRPADDHALFLLAGAYYDFERFDLARSCAQEAISLAPSEWLYHYLLGLIEKRSARWPQAQSSLETAARLHPAAAEVHNALGEVALQKGERQRAIAYFQRAVELDPKEPAYKLNLDGARR